MNCFGEKFEKLLKKYDNQDLLVKETYMSDYICYRDDFPEEILLECYSLAVEKAKFVNKKNQNGDVRNNNSVLTNVFKGIMAETVAQIFLIKKCEKEIDEVRRFDLERESFKYDPSKEYDVGLFKNDNFKWEIGVKTSKIDKKNLESFLKNQHCIIGKYKSTSRPEDHNSSFYLGVITVYEGKYDESKFISEYMEGKIHTYIVSGATFSEMKGQYSNNNINMNQPNAVYNLGLRSMYAGDANDCIKKFMEFCENKTSDYKYSKYIKK